jgi:hypothetical protein
MVMGAIGMLVPLPKELPIKLVFNSTKIISVLFQVYTLPQKFLGTTNCSLTKK